MIIRSLLLFAVLLAPSQIRAQRESVESLIAILSRPEVKTPVRDQTVVGVHLRSSWDGARRLLAPRVAEARPLLVAMLRDAAADTRDNALILLADDEPAQLAPLRPQLIALLGDPTPRVRAHAALTLGRAKDAAAEDALLAALARLRRHARTAQDSEGIDVAVGLIAALDKPPCSAAKVIPAIVPFLDTKSEPQALVWKAMQNTRLLARDPASGPLLAAYWRVLSTTSNEGLASIAASALDGPDLRVLDYLRRVPQLRDPRVRAHGVARLVSHPLFDPRREAALFERLIVDPSSWVRVTLVSSLCSRAATLEEKVQLQTAERLWKDSDPKVREQAVVGVFDVIEKASKETSARLYADRELALPAHMIRALDDAQTSRLIAAQTARLRRPYQATPTDSVAAIDAARRWWQERSP